MRGIKIFFVILVLFLIWDIVFRQQGRHVDASDINMLQIAGSQEAATSTATTIARKKGGRYAFYVLRAAKFSSGINKHKLGHAVGAVLFQQEGLAGITACVDEYRNSCSHAVVAGAMTQEGQAVIPKLVAVCDRSKEGLPGISRCYHGVGHGVMVNFGYDFPKTMNLCIALGTRERNYVESAECMGGAFMEFVSKDIHDEKTHTPALKQYFDVVDPLYPCREAFIPRYLREHCFHYVPQLLVTRAGLEGKDKPTAYCSSGVNDEEKKFCYRAFGTQFTLTGITEDIMEVRETDHVRLASIVRQCTLTQSVQGNQACIEGALETILWGGGKEAPNVDVAVALCKAVDDQTRDGCFRYLIESYFRRPGKYVSKRFCQTLPVEYQLPCGKN
ncbi:hypothetical protein HY086_03905 [Candidatus Gottesmanbacteria bacterium]|nr:hypothetical protein [Candidatus Gottesmanbacteria bacterium]